MSDALHVKKFCDDASTAYRVGNVGLFSFVHALLRVAAVLGIMAMLIKQRWYAQRGTDGSIGKALIFPVYFWIMGALAVVETLTAITDLAIPLEVDELVTGSTESLRSIFYALLWSALHFIVEGIAFFLMQKGAGVNSIKRACALGGVWAIITFVVHFVSLLSDSEQSRTSAALLLTWESAMIVFYFSLRFLPLSWLHRRPAIHGFALFWLLYRLCSATAVALEYKHYDAGKCVYIFSSWAMFGFTKSFIIYIALRSDSRYWIGAFRPKKKRRRSIEWSDVGFSPYDDDTDTETRSNHSSEDSPRNANAGGDRAMWREYRSLSNDVTSPLLGVHFHVDTAAQVAAGLDSLQHVHVINFNSLSLGRSYKLLGAGGTSRVYRGTYRNMPVAIKIIYCVELTPSIVSNFYKEARVLAKLHHPNVVQLVGICVAPPALCLVIELCQGTLFDYIHADRSDPVQVQRSPLAGLVREADMRTRIRIALECAAGVAYLHSRNPPILHRDIKSLNFLLTSDLRVKICDFELSRDEGEALQPPDSLHWMAPEVAADESAYTEKSDVYSLGVVLWELFTERLPFDEERFRVVHNGRFAIRAALREGTYRFPFPPQLSPALAQLLQEMLARDQAARPTAQRVVDRMVLLFQHADAL